MKVTPAKSKSQFYLYKKAPGADLRGLIIGLTDYFTDFENSLVNRSHAL